jgi:cytochrome c oxidase subunit 2
MQSGLIFNLTEGVSPTSYDVYHLHMTIFWVCVVIAALVFGAMFYALFHFRKSKGAVPSQVNAHLGLEITWTIIPIIILVFMAVPATRVLLNMNNSDKEAVTIKITGYQWRWQYEYLEDDVSFFSSLSTPYSQLHNQAPKGEHYLLEVDHPLVLPIHEKIRFLITSNDVNHSWWVPALAVKRDAIPGYINEGWTVINKPGIYRGQCAELCGMNHAYMPIVVIAVPEATYHTWIAQQKTQGGSVTPVATTSAPVAAAPASPEKPAAPLTPAEALKAAIARGEVVYNNTCAVCHQPNGEGVPPTFPSLKKDKITTGPVEGHLNRVLNGKPGTAMQAFKTLLNDQDIADVVTYERNAFGNNMGTLVTPDQVKAARAKPPLQSANGDYL